MNKDAGWEECIESGMSYNISVDKSKIKSLIDTANERIEFADKIKVNDDSNNYVFEYFYTSILELLHALLIKNGFKVRNHICLGYFLRDNLGREDLFRIFNDARFKRNRLVYYGKKMEYEACNLTIKKVEILINELLKMLQK